VEASKAVTASGSPAIVISASGMCEAGRILHHLKIAIEDEKNTVLIVGFQAQHTLGRRLVEKRAREDLRRRAGAALPRWWCSTASPRTPIRTIS
jgi:predicted metal-dependent RNase